MTKVAQIIFHLDRRIFQRLNLDEHFLILIKNSFESLLCLMAVFCQVRKDALITVDSATYDFKPIRKLTEANIILC